MVRVGEVSSLWKIFSQNQEKLANTTHRLSFSLIFVYTDDEKMLFRNNQEPKLIEAEGKFSRFSFFF